MNWTRIFRARNRSAPADRPGRPPALAVELLEDRSTPSAAVAGAVDGGDAATTRESAWRMQVAGTAVTSDALTSLVAPTPTAATAAPPAAAIPLGGSTISPVATPSLAGFPGVGFFGGPSLGTGPAGLGGSTASPTPFTNAGNTPGLTIVGMTDGLSTGTDLTAGIALFSGLGGSGSAAPDTGLGALNTLISPGFTAVPRSELTTTTPAPNVDNMATSAAFFGASASANLARGIVIV
jgi:hypothetical protein